MRNPYKATINFDRAFTETPATFDSGVRHTLASLPRESIQRSRPPIRRALLLTAVWIACLAGAAVAAQMSGLLNLFLPVAPSAQPLVRTNVAEAVLEDCAASIREVIWDGETLGLVYVVTDPALEQVDGFTPPESEEVRLSSALDRYGWQHMAEEIRVGEGQILRQVTMDVRWGDAHDQVIYYMEAALPTANHPYEISLEPYCSKGALPMRFTLDAPNAQDVRDFALPVLAEFDGFAVRVTRHRETPLRLYVDLEVLVSSELEKDAAARILDRWGKYVLLGAEGGYTQTQGAVSRGQPFGYQATVSLNVKAEDGGKGSRRIAPLGADGQPVMAEAIVLSDQSVN